MIIGTIIFEKVFDENKMRNIHLCDHETIHLVKLSFNKIVPNIGDLICILEKEKSNPTLYNYKSYSEYIKELLFLNTNNIIM